MTMFGRDSIFTSLQALPFAPELAATTLTALGEWQGNGVDDFRDEDPGRILHEMRYGEMTAFEERPHSPYYGCADATPLYVVLLDEYERWTGDRKLVRALEYEARKALAWIDDYADLQGDGYVWYQRRNEKTGLENQCWKDSWDSISYRDGKLPGFPRATCELQGYAYDAKMRGARLARLVWKDPEFADALEKQAADLKRRFNRDYWVEDDEYFALALDSEGKQVDALTSNNGHLLWSGIVDKSKAKAVARHLVGPRLFSGWGVRTLAEGEGRYNPIGYHVGTVWPFDNSFVAWGLRRYGFKEEAAQIASGILDAAEFFDGRLPEAFGGYERSATKYPVQYPTACSPQAWSTGAPLLFLRTMLGLEPEGEHLVIDPALPDDDRPAGAPRHPGPVGPHRRLRARPGRGRRPSRGAFRANHDPREEDTMTNAAAPLIDGAEGHGAIAGSLLGSVSAVVRRSKRPVVVVHRTELTTGKRRSQTDGGAWCARAGNVVAVQVCEDAPGKIRTCDLCLRRAALYPLSYGRLGASSVAVPPMRPSLGHE